MKTRLLHVFFALLLAVANAGATNLALHCQGTRALAFAPDTEKILERNGLTAGTYVIARLGPAHSYPKSSVLHASHYSVDAFVPIVGMSAADEVAAALAPRSKSRAAEIRKYVGEAQRRGLTELPYVDFFPREIRKTGFVDCDGPNCFNTAARFHNPHLPRAEMEPADKIKLLQKEYVQLGKGETLEPGDELVVWLPSSDPTKTSYDVAGMDPTTIENQAHLLHAMIYIDPWTVYQKGSALKDSPIGFETMTSAMRPYHSWDPIVTVHRKKAAAPKLAGPLLIVPQ